MASKHVIKRLAECDVKNLTLAHRSQYSIYLANLAPAAINYDNDACIYLQCIKHLLRCNGHVLEKEKAPDKRIKMLFHLLGIAMLAGLAGLVAYELIAEVRGAGERLQDRYHE